MTRLFSIVLLAAATAAPLSVTGCESDDPCASDDCDSDQDELSEEEEEAEPPPLETPCRDACAALIGDCDATDPSFKINQQSCIQWCKEGGMSTEEASCLAAVDCGGGVDQCFTAVE